MSEPEYVFRKGQGWIVKPPVDTWTTEVTNSHGRFKVTLYDRFPEIGEHFYEFYRNLDDDCIVDDTWVWEKAWDAVKRDMNYRPLDMGGFVESQHHLGLLKQNRFPNKNLKWLTIHVEQLERA